MDITRRGFLKVSAAFAALAGLQKVVPNLVNPEVAEHWADKFARTGILEDVTLYLDKPLELSSVYGDGAMIRNCKFVANEGFQGESMMILGDVKGWCIRDCMFDTNNIPLTGITMDMKG